MFRWLTSWISGANRKETEVRKLKEEIESNLEKCKRAAAAGDPEATVRLRSFEETISEQSLRLLRGPRPTK